MQDESANQQWSDVDPSLTKLDNPENLNFWEPELEEAKPVAQSKQDEQEDMQESSQDEETEELEAKNEDDSGEKSTEEPEEANLKEENTEDVIVTLKGGEKVTIDELKNGYMRDKDFRQKTMALADRRRALESTTTEVNNIIQALGEYISTLIPQEPDLALAATSPEQYIQQFALHNSAKAQLQQVLALGGKPKEIAESLTAEQQNEIIHQERNLLDNAFPKLREDKAYEQKFFAGAQRAARALGFSDEDFSGVTDHRLIAALHYVKKGMDAEHAQKNALKKVSSAPPMVPQKQHKPQTRVSQEISNNRKAMDKLRKTGSLKDAMLVDFI